MINIAFVLASAVAESMKRIYDWFVRVENNKFTPILTMFEDVLRTFETI